MAIYGSHLIIITILYELDNFMKRICFVKNYENYYNEGEFVAYLHQINGEDDLHVKLSEVLSFPDYYGRNWNALNDCLKDFSWINQKGITLVHTSLPNLSVDELIIYIEIIFESVESWEEGDSHYFKVIFPKETEEVINNIRHTSI